jgi:hypothetical protein
LALPKSVEASMIDTTCIVYEIFNDGLACSKLNRYYGTDETNPDSAVCAALINSDKNHFYFSYPTLVPGKHYKYACAWCHALCDKEFCSNECAVNSDLKYALEEAEADHKNYQKADTLKYYNFELDLAS